jgi:uncharacterized protein with HEPN domain
MQKSPSPYIHHIIEASTKISDYLEGIDQHKFSSQSMAYDAIVRNLEIIGEACNHLEEEFKSSHPKIPWSQIIGMRNKLAHEYWDIDSEIVWEAAAVESQKLKKQLLELLNKLGQ